MKKSIKVILAGMLAVPVLALGMSLAGPVSQPVYAQATNNVTKGAEAAQGDNTPSNLFTGENPIFKTIANTALYIIGALSVLMLIYGGIRYTISGGDEKSVTSAKNTILYAVVGIVVALMAYAIVNFVLGSLILQS